jgi:hypothetical protein
VFFWSITNSHSLSLGTMKAGIRPCQYLDETYSFNVQLLHFSKGFSPRLSLKCPEWFCDAFVFLNLALWQFPDIFVFYICLSQIIVILHHVKVHTDHVKVHTEHPSIFINGCEEDEFKFLLRHPFAYLASTLFIFWVTFSDLVQYIHVEKNHFCYFNLK